MDHAAIKARRMRQAAAAGLTLPQLDVVEKIGGGEVFGFREYQMLAEVIRHGNAKVADMLDETAEDVMDDTDRAERDYWRNYDEEESRRDA